MQNPNDAFKKVIGKFKTSIKSRTDEAADYLMNGRSIPMSAAGHDLRIQM